VREHTPQGKKERLRGRKREETSTGGNDVKRIHQHDRESLGSSTIPFSEGEKTGIRGGVRVGPREPVVAINLNEEEYVASLETPRKKTGGGGRGSGERKRVGGAKKSSDSLVRDTGRLLRTGWKVPSA